MDNLQAHKSTRVGTLIESAGASVLFFYRLTHRISQPSKKPSRRSRRSFLRSIEARTQETLVEAIGQALDALSRRDVLGWFAHCGYRFTDQLA